ncbi:alpha/beta hydrolase-fold protein [Algiphilus sp.]|uniref:alpha/beta hydrolase-fold protein n=1 Tax=Algiphilus sp. TaxID=1872431 RepID=UPI003B526EC0
MVLLLLLLGLSACSGQTESSGTGEASTAAASDQREASDAPSESGSAGDSTPGASEPAGNPAPEASAGDSGLTDEAGAPQQPDAEAGAGQDDEPEAGVEDTGDDAEAGDDAASDDPTDAGSEDQAQGEGTDTASDGDSEVPTPEVEPAPMTTERRQFRGRSYLVYRPSPVRPGTPVVFLLHAATEGMNSVFDDNRPSAAWKTLARDDQFILVAPHGSSPEGETESDAAYWNDCADNSRQTRLNSSADDIGFLSALVERVVVEYQADPGAVYAYGLSNGGSMALRLAQEAPERVAGVVSVLGLAAEEGECVTPATPVPVMLMHGTEDPLARYEDGRGTFRDYLLGAEESYRFWLELNGVAAESERQIVFADRDPSDESSVSCLAQGADERRVQLCTMDGAGHLDPSVTRFYGSASSSFGRQNRDIESAVVAWAFMRDAVVGTVVSSD